MRRFFFATVAISTIAVPLSVFAADVTVNERIDLVLPSDNSTYTLEPSSFNTLTVNSDNFSFAIPERSSVELASPQSKKLTNDLQPTNATIKCSGGESRIVLVKNPGEGNQTVTVTPSGTCSSSSSSSSGGNGSASIGSTAGGGGGGGVTPPPSPVPATPPVAPNKLALTPPPTAPIGTSAPATPSISAAFAKDLSYGMKNDDVRRLQELLALDKSIYPEGLAIGIFGPATRRAVKRFQAKYGLPQVGRVGKQTRAKLEEVFGKETVPAPVPPPALQPSQPSSNESGSVSAEFTKDLAFGSKGNDVKRLQELLAQDHSVYPEGTINGIFGPATTRAVKRFQARYSLPQVGRVGPQTRAKLQGVFGGQSPSPQPTSSSNAEAADAAVKQLQDQLKELQQQLQLLQGSH